LQVRARRRVVEFDYCDVEALPETSWPAAPQVVKEFEGRRLAAASMRRDFDGSALSRPARLGGCERCFGKKLETRS
jgi:hypothetical protein